MMRGAAMDTPTADVQELVGETRTVRGRCTTMESVVTANGAPVVGGQQGYARWQHTSNWNGTKAHEQRRQQMEIQFGRAHLLARPWEPLQHRVNVLNGDLHKETKTHATLEESTPPRSALSNPSYTLSQVSKGFSTGLRNYSSKGNLENERNDEWNSVYPVGFLSPVSLVPATDVEDDALDLFPPVFNSTLLSPIHEECTHSTTCSNMVSPIGCQKGQDNQWKDSGVTSASSSGYVSMLTASSSTDSLLQDSTEPLGNGASRSGQSASAVGGGTLKSKDTNTNHSDCYDDRQHPVLFEASYSMHSAEELFFSSEPCHLHLESFKGSGTLDARENSRIPTSPAVKTTIQEKVATSTGGTDSFSVHNPGKVKPGPFVSSEGNKTIMLQRDSGQGNTQDDNGGYTVNLSDANSRDGTMSSYLGDPKHSAAHPQSSSRQNRDSACSEQSKKSELSECLSGGTHDSLAPSVDLAVQSNSTKYVQKEELLDSWGRHHSDNKCRSAPDTMSDFCNMLLVMDHNAKDVIHGPLLPSHTEQNVYNADERTSGERAETRNLAICSTPLPYRSEDPPKMNSIAFKEEAAASDVCEGPGSGTSANFHDNGYCVSDVENKCCGDVLACSDVGETSCKVRTSSCHTSSHLHFTSLIDKNIISEPVYLHNCSKYPDQVCNVCRNCVNGSTGSQRLGETFQADGSPVQTDGSEPLTSESSGMLSQPAASTPFSNFVTLAPSCRQAVVPVQSQVKKITPSLEKWSVLERQSSSWSSTKPGPESADLISRSLPLDASSMESDRSLGLVNGDRQQPAKLREKSSLTLKPSHSLEAGTRQKQVSNLDEANVMKNSPAPAPSEVLGKGQSAFPDIHARTALPSVRSLVAKFTHPTAWSSSSAVSLDNRQHRQQQSRYPSDQQAFALHLLTSQSIDIKQDQLQKEFVVTGEVNVNEVSGKMSPVQHSDSTAVAESPLSNVTDSPLSHSIFKSFPPGKSPEKTTTAQLQPSSKPSVPSAKQSAADILEPASSQTLEPSLVSRSFQPTKPASQQQSSVQSSRFVTLSATNHNATPQPTLSPSSSTVRSQAARARVGAGHSVALLRLSRGQTVQSQVFKKNEEEMRKDGRTVYRSHEEQSFSETRSDGHPPQQLIDSGFGSSSMMREDFSASGAGGLQNGEQARDPNVAREERQREDFHFTEMSSVKNQFERGAGPTPAPRRGLDVRAEVAAAEGGVYESQPTTFEPQWQEEVEEGVYENEPVQRPDVVKETDRNVAAELPAVGMARNIRERFQSGKVEASSTAAKREIIPAADAVDGGVFENQPKYNPDVVHSGEGVQEELPEQGTARNLAAKFKQMEKQGGVPSPATQGRRELTPDRTGRVEYVSEPRGYIEKYEGQSEAGVFESNPEERGDVVKSDYQLEEALPERGTAKNIAQQFRQLSTSGGSAARAKREITPDTSGRSEYVSEPREFVETYEGRAESGVFESQPVDRPDVVKSDQLTDEVLPERGAARNIAAKFREMESAMKSPPQSPSRRKEFTPPRDDTDRTVAGVVENTPTVSSDVVHSGEQVEEVMPERGTAKSMVNRFKQMGSGSSSAGQSPRPKKEFTPPPADSGVFENNPQEFVPDYNPPPESGIIESHPQQRTDVVRGDEPPNYEQELPERGSARSLVSAWRQRESENVKGSPTASAKLKEFTPPRDEPRVVQQRSACRTPKSPLTGGESLDEGSIQPSDLPDQYQRQEEASVYESQPERLEGVVSEQDTDWTEGLPKKDTTKKMLAKFKHIQAEASKESPRPVPSGRKEEEDNSSEPTPDKVVRSKSMRVAVQLEKCGACGKTVYAMEKIEIEKNAYHKACFRCSHCHCVLTPKTFAVNNHVMFCTTHYKQLFATKGNYDEGFGRDQHKKRWKSESNLAEDLQNKSPQ